MTEPLKKDAAYYADIRAEKLAEEKVKQDARLRLANEFKIQNVTKVQTESPTEKLKRRFYNNDTKI
jgi:hypothetical protein